MLECVDISVLRVNPLLTTADVTVMSATVVMNKDPDSASSVLVTVNVVVPRVV